MKRFRIFLIAILAVGLAFGLMISCQQMPTAPVATPSSAQFQVVPVNPDYIGLAKMAQSDTSFITVADGGSLGGYLETDNNYVTIPPNTLTQDLYLAFSLVYVDDPADSLYGALGFSLSSFSDSTGGGASEHVMFTEGNYATLYLNKVWLNGTPNAVVNLETGEIVSGVVDAGEYWAIQVPHFSVWSWVWNL